MLDPQKVEQEDGTLVEVDEAQSVCAAASETDYDRLTAEFDEDYNFDGKI